MSIYLICLTTNGGLPILTRKKGNCGNLPFSTIASLNGLHMFFKSLGVNLYTTYADNWTYVWRDFFNTITIIVCCNGISSFQTELLPEIIFGAFLLFISRDEMSQPNFLRRLKNESKNYLRLIDGILELCLNQMLGFSSCLLSSDNSQILQSLNEDFSIQCGSLFCCLVVGHKIAVATEGWWDLDIVDRQLLLLFLQSSNRKENDAVVYLPKKSPNVAYRFITLSISASSVLCVICGAEPSLRSLHDIADRTFRSDLNLIQNMEKSIPRCIPENIELDSGIVAIIVANRITKKCVFSTNNCHATSSLQYLGEPPILHMFRTFFDDTISNADSFSKNLSTTSEVFEVTNQFWSLDTHKCLSLFDEDNNVICLLFISSIPMHTMKYNQYILSCNAKCIYQKKYWLGATQRKQVFSARWRKCPDNLLVLKQCSHYLICSVQPDFQCFEMFKCHGNYKNRRATCSALPNRMESMVSFHLESHPERRVYVMVTSLTIY